MRNVLLRRNIAELVVKRKSILVSGDRTPFFSHDGKPYRVYVDIHKLFTTGYDRRLVIMALDDTIRDWMNDTDQQTGLFGMTASGAVWASLLAEYRNDLLLYVRDNYTSFGRETLIEGDIEHIRNTSMKRIVVDDVLSTGNTMQAAITRMNRIKLEPDLALVVMDHQRSDLLCPVRSVIDWTDILNLLITTKTPYNSNEIDTIMDFVEKLNEIRDFETRN